MKLCHFKKILVVKNRGLGDAVMGLSSLQFLVKCFPEAKIVYAVPAWVAPLFHEVDIAADEVFPLNLSSTGSYVRFVSFLFKEKFDCIIELHQGGKTGKIFSLLKPFLGYNYFFHNHHQKSDSYILDQGKPKANIQRDLDGVWSALVTKCQFNFELPSYLDLEPKMKVQENEDFENFCVLGVVATRPTKMWRLQNYKEVVLKLLLKDPTLKILIPLAKKIDDKLRAELESLSMPLNVQIIQNDLNEIPDLFYGAKFYLGNDTGLKHIAVALGIKTYTFFGPEDPMEWHPYNKEKHIYFFEKGLDCRTEIAHYCPLETCESMICLDRITVEKVAHTILQDCF
jgi:heptosyltransferase-2